MTMRILQLEDVPEDAELVLETLVADELDCEIRRVDTREAFLAALEAGGIDLILSDYALPSFDGFSALDLARRRWPDVPFIFLSGTIGEELAIEAVKRGATDYVLKQRLTRLPLAVTRALREAQERAALRRSEALIREQAALLDEARDAILVRDLAETVVFWNRGAERLYGWSAREATGRRATDLFVAGETGEWRRLRDEALARGESMGELAARTRDGRTVVVESRWTLVRDEAGALRSVLQIDTDVTEKKALQAQFLRAQRVESIGTLAGGIAHDLNNILSPILMAVELLRRGSVDDRSARLLGTVESSARRGADLVRQILTFARGAEGERIALSPHQLLTELVSFTHETFPKEIQVRVEAPPDLWSPKGDATQLHQVLLNLCVNARDAMPDGGVLTVSAENVLLDESYARMRVEALPGRYVVLTVSDTGAGIPPALLGKIFDPFFTTKEVGKGTGLGLSTAVAIVKSHGGFINVYSEAGRGSAFKIYVPAAEPRAAANEEGLSHDQPQGHGEQVLVVDDEASIREIARETLEANGYRVMTAGDGAAAVALYSRHADDIDVVITDARMPYMDGQATARALEHLNPAVRVVLTSGLDCGDLQEDRTTPAVRAFLQKPYTAQALLRTLHDVLG